MRGKILSDLSIKLIVAQNEAQKLIDKYGITSPEHIQLKNIAFRENAFVIEEPVARATASLVKSKNGATIRVSPYDRIERQRFSIAYELGHLKLNHIAGKIQKACTKEDMRSWYKKSIETEANYFASELILPTKLVEGMCDVREANFEPIQEIAKIFRASLTATAIKFVQLNAEQCAFVYSEAGKITWSCNSPDWQPFIQRGKPLDNKTGAYDFFKGKDLYNEPIEVEAIAWFDRSCGDKYIVEHSIGSHEFESVLTLLWIRP